jgi:hypothetical protein
LVVVVVVAAAAAVVVVAAVAAAAAAAAVNCSNFGTSATGWTQLQFLCARYAADNRKDNLKSKKTLVQTGSI